jgi:hypothetical protein
MPNVQRFQDVIDSEYSSEADKAVAASSLCRIANPEEVVQEVDLTDPKAGAPLDVLDMEDSPAGELSREEYYRQRRVVPTTEKNGFGNLIKWSRRALYLFEEENFPTILERHRQEQAARVAPVTPVIAAVPVAVAVAPGMS